MFLEWFQSTKEGMMHEKIAEKKIWYRISLTVSTKVCLEMCSSNDAHRKQCSSLNAILDHGVRDGMGKGMGQARKIFTDR